jgi:hypothetical protein
VDSGIKKASRRWAGSPANKALAVTHGVLRNLTGLRLKEVSWLIAFVKSRLSVSAPLGTMPHNPISQSPFKPDVATGFLRLNPLVPQNLLALCLELAIKRRILKQIVPRRNFFGIVRHRPTTNS